MTAKEIIELFIQSTSPEFASNVEPDSVDPEVLFKHQLVKGKSYKKDALMTKLPRDLNFNVDTDNSWMSSSDKYA